MADERIFKDQDWKFQTEWALASPPQALDIPNDQVLTLPGNPFLPIGGGDHRAELGLRASLRLLAGRQQVVEGTSSSGYWAREKLFTVSLENTFVEPRPGADPASQTTPSDSGWYVDLIDIEMGFDGDPQGVELKSAAPQTTSLSGNAGSAVSYTISAGFFGDQITGTFSKSWSHSFDYSLQDYLSQNNSTFKTYHNQVRMGMSLGAPYTRPEDLVDGSLTYLESSTNTQSPSHPLRGLPPKAISRLELGCQGIWVAQPSVGATLPFVIKVTPRFVRLILTYRQAAGALNQFEWRVYQEVRPLAFRTDVDFSNVGFTKKTVAATPPTPPPPPEAARPPETETPPPESETHADDAEAADDEPGAQT